MKVGLSLGDCYEGFIGTWNVHGGVEYLRPGAERTQAFGENQVIGSIGVGFSY